MSLAGGGLRHLEELDRVTAMCLLSRERVGRLAFCLNGRPHIEVVNFVVVDGDVLFRIAVGAKSAALGNSGTFALQCDRLNPANRTGWTVTVRGPARSLRPAEVAALAELPDPWAPGERRRIVRLAVREVFGRAVCADE